jgi:hypothetical protein
VHFHLPEDEDGNGLITDANGKIEWDTNDSIDYQYIPGQHVLRRLEKGQQRELVQDVSDVQFIDADIDPTLSPYEVKIILTLSKVTPKQRNISITLSSIVRLRN